VTENGGRIQVIFRIETTRTVEPRQAEWVCCKYRFRFKVYAFDVYRIGAMYS